MEQNIDINFIVKALKNYTPTEKNIHPHFFSIHLVEFSTKKNLRKMY